MGGALSSNNVAPQNPDSELIKGRLEAHRRKARADIGSMLKALEAKQRDFHDGDPLDLSRPYGLGEGMEGFRRHIWELIFVHVNDLDTIVSLREVCMMFRDLLEMKYKAARLPEVIVKCLERKIIPWEHIIHGEHRTDYSGTGTTERSNWVMILESLRFISKTTKNSVDIQFDRGMFAQGSREREAEAELFSHDRGWGLYSNFRVCKAELWKIPNLVFGAKDAYQARLKRTLNILENDEASVDNFSVRALVLDECRRGGPFGRQDLHRDLHDEFVKCLEKIGHKITSFGYRTFQSHNLYSYNNLRKWLPHMPNLEELILDPVDPPSLNWLYDQFVDPFVTCPKLKRFAEGFSHYQFDYDDIAEILRANPTIEEVLLRRIPTSAEEKLILNQALRCLPLKKLYITGALFNVSLFEYTFQDQWDLSLTQFILMDTRIGANDQHHPWHSPYLLEKNQSDEVFAFLSKLKNLKVLGIMSEWIRDTGGYLHLPKLESVYLKVSSDFKNLDFLKPVENLKWLYLELSDCLNDPQLNGINLMQYLGKYNIPSLFPALRKIKTKRSYEKFKKVWEPSDY